MVESQWTAVGSPSSHDIHVLPLRETLNVPTTTWGLYYKVSRDHLKHGVRIMDHHIIPICLFPVMVFSNETTRNETGTFPICTS